MEEGYLGSVVVVEGYLGSVVVVEGYRGSAYLGSRAASRGSEACRFAEDDV